MSRIRHATETYVNENDKILADKFNILSSDVGTGTLTTAAKNLKGAVNELDDETSILNNDRGYLKSKGTQDLNKQVNNGKYVYSGGADVLNKPSNVYGYLDVTDYGNGYALQKVTDGNGKKFEREMKGNVWDSKWREISTTDKVDILLTPKPGYKIVKQRNYKLNNEIFIDTTIATEDDSNFPIFDTTKNMVNIPSTYRPTHGSYDFSSLSSSRLAEGSTPRGNQSALVWWATGDIFLANPTINNIKQINVSGSYLI